jgi:hypothetical protein
MRYAEAIMTTLLFVFVILLGVSVFTSISDYMSGKEKIVNCDDTIMTHENCFRD